MSELMGTMTLDEVGDRGNELYHRVIEPKLKPEDYGKYVAINVETGDYEMDASDYDASIRLRERFPQGELWLERVGYPATYMMRSPR